MIILGRIAVLAALVMAGGCDRGPLSPEFAATPRAGATSIRPLDDADQRFVAQAAADGIFHSRVAALAARKARDPEVRAFAQMMAAHQTAAHEQLRRIADAHALALPRAMPHDQQRLLDQLDGLSTPEFERRFVQLIGVQEQRRCIGEFTQAARSAQDEDVQGFARDMLGVMKWQLAAAKQLPGAMVS